MTVHFLFIKSANHNEQFNSRSFMLLGAVSSGTVTSNKSTDM
jgi:hypothetical protein